jgi:GNAT superfamily N-acetyltransferase
MSAVPPLPIDQLTRKDEPAAVASLAAAFATYPLFPPLCPKPERRPRLIEAFCRMLFRMSVRCGGVFATPDRAAVACVWPPGWEWPSSWLFARGGLALLWQLGWRGSRLLARFEQIFDAARVKHVPGPHWYLPLLGVRPEMQGKGLSRAVMRPIFEAADRDKVPVYLETMPETNVPLYRKLGFELLGRSELPGGLPNWEMARAPR